MSAQTDSFQTTHWSVVLSSIDGDLDRAAKGLESLNQLCRTYWRPLYIYLRRCGFNAHDAEDLTQQFLMELLQRDGLSSVHPKKGKFRSFLIASLKNFVSHQRSRNLAQKRGGGACVFSMDDPSIESACLLLKFTGSTSEEDYERHWALTVLDQVRLRLRGEYIALGKEACFEQLAEFLPGSEPDKSQQEIAHSLGITVSAVKSEVYRLRQRFGQYLRAEIANTVASADEIDGEIEYLIQVVSRNA
jgi:RNA polymerase sigma factor (sigma-70 family)